MNAFIAKLEWEKLEKAKKHLLARTSFSKLSFHSHLGSRFYAFLSFNADPQTLSPCGWWSLNWEKKIIIFFHRIWSWFERKMEINEIDTIATIMPLNCHHHRADTQFPHHIHALRAHTPSIMMIVVIFHIFIDV